MQHLVRYHGAYANRARRLYRFTESLAEAEDVAGPRAGFYNVAVKLSAPLLVLLVIAPSARSEGDEKEKEKERARVVFHFTEVKPGGSAEKALAEYSKWVNEGADPAKLPATMEAMYKAAGGGATSFKKIAHLIAKGLEPGEVADKSLKHLQIDEAHSKQMAKVREANIERIVEDILKSKKGEWKIGRSDSGNPSSGMKSDLDQTMYVFKKGPHGQWVRDLNADKLFVQEFSQRWKAEFPHLSLAAMDIASIEGKQRFPDPRDVQLDFEGKFLETIDILRRTPGAYTYPGAVVSQMQLRALLAVLQDTPRSFMEYELGKDGKMKKLPFNRDFAQRILFGIRPALMPGHAYGAAVANYLTLQTYVQQGKIDPKYHLRVWDDCGQVLAAVEGKLRQGLHEYIDLPADERARRNKMIVDAMFADPVRQELHKLALDASADLRLIHKGGDKNLKRVFGDTVPPPEGYDAKVFDKLARALHDLPPTGDPAPTDKQIGSAVAEHRRLASEYCLESVYRSSVEAYKLYKDVRFHRPISVEGYHHLMRAVKQADWPKTRKNLEFMSRMTFLYSLYDLGWYKSGKLLLRLRKQFPQMGLVEVGELWARGRVQNLVAPLRNAKLRQAMLNDLHRKLSLEIDLDDFTVRGVKANIGKLNERVQRRIFTELGFRHVEGAEMVGHLLRLKKLSWRPGRLIKHALWDPGSLDALAQIARAFVLSDGDLEHVQEVALNEMIFAVPVAGQIYAVSKGGVQGVVLMAGAIQFPPFGVVLVVCSVGEAGYAIYDGGYAKHVRNNVVDAIYRGFSGPATRVYDSPPAQFTDGDEHKLKILRRRLERAKEKKNEAEAKELTPRVAALQQRKEAWKAFRDGSWAGNYWYEWGAQKEQKTIRVSLLMDVPPIISFSPMGIIDFRADHNPRRDNPRIAELEAIVKATEKDAREFETYLKAAHELDELILQRDRYERARRYLQAAAGQDRTGLSELEQRQGIPELLHKLRRDSLYPALKERAIRLKDRKGNFSTPNPDTFVDEWIAAVGDWAVRELTDKGVWSGDVDDLRGRGFLWAPSLVDKLKERLYEDYSRSKHLYLRFLEIEKNRKEVAKIRLERRIEIYKAAKTGLAIEGFDLSQMAAALLMSAVRRHAPTVDADVIVVRKQGGGDEELHDRAEVTVRVRVKADRHLYQGPYSWTLHRLNRAAAAAAIASGRLPDSDIPLTAESKAKLEKLVQAAGGQEVMIPVVSVFCTKMPDLSQALQGTVDHLPHTRTSNGIFMGQTVPVGKPEVVEEEEPEEEEEVAPAGPARIMMAIPQPATRAERLAGKVKIRWEEPSPDNATFVAYHGETHKGEQARPYLWIEWPDMPEKKRYALEWHVKGCVPLVEYQPKRGTIAHLARKGFDKSESETRELRRPENRFVISVPLGHYFRSAGDLRVRGRLMAFDSKQKWREDSTKPEAELPFDVTVTYHPPRLVAEGTSRVNRVGHASGSISVRNAQAGGRVARIEAGGGTYHCMFDGGASFSVPHAGSAPGTARITFRNFGKDVTVEARLKVLKSPERQGSRTENLAKTLQEIDRLKKVENGRDRFLTKIIVLYDRCQGMFTASSENVTELGKWRQYTELLLAEHEHLFKSMANAGWIGWENSELQYEYRSMKSVLKTGQAQAGIDFHRWKYGQWLANRYAAAMRTMKRSGRLDLFDKYLGRAQALVAQMKPNKKWTPECWRTLSRGYRMKAEMVFHATGDFKVPQKLVETANEHMRTADGMTGNLKKEYPPFWIKPDPEFDGGDG
ncbi:MAG: hypothetical protein ACYTFD_13720 [Planctomycetota bacterium]